LLDFSEAIVRNSIIESVEKSHLKKRPNFRVGDRVNISVRLKEGDKERIQAFRGIVISKQPKSGKGPQATFTVRKISEGVGVERIFPVHSPFIESIDVESSSEVRRSRLYYLRSLKGKKARLKEAERFGEDLVVEKVTAAPAAPATGTEITDSASTAANKDDKKK
jgi:large subunit ribosomal protein L19